MLTNRTLARINNRPRTIGRLTLLAVGGGTLILSALLYAFGILPPFPFSPSSAACCSSSSST